MMDLIKRLEAASEGSRDLDVELAAALSLRYGEYRSHRTNVTQPGCNWTRSLDAALTLVPNDLIWDVTSTGTAWVMDANVIPCGAQWFGKAASPALAICIAALRARNEGEGRA